MNSDQAEEYEALTYIFTSTEMEKDNNVLEFVMAECDNLKIEFIWPEAYPTCPLLVSISDQRLKDIIKDQIEAECELLVVNI